MQGAGSAGGLRCRGPAVQGVGSLCDLEVGWHQTAGPVEAGLRTSLSLALSFPFFRWQASTLPLGLQTGLPSSLSSTSLSFSGDFAPHGVWQCLETSLIVMTGACHWQLVIENSNIEAYLGKLSRRGRRLPKGNLSSLFQYVSRPLRGM